LKDSSYGAVTVDGERIFVEYDDRILVGDLSFKDDFVRFIGKSGEPIDNWDMANGYLAVLVEGEITVFNKSAVPIMVVGISEIFSDLSSFNISDISISDDGTLAIAGFCSIKDENEKFYRLIAKVRSLTL